MTNRDEQSKQIAKAKRRTQKTFEQIEFKIDGRKSCHIDERTTIFIDKKSNCDIERKKFLQTHQDYAELYNGHWGGRKSKFKL